MLTLTGERTLPGIAHENYWFRRHEAAYLALRSLVAGLQVLEAGAGEGYGAELLRASAREVVALELDQSAAAHASASYLGVPVLRGDLQCLPLRPDSIEALACLQTIEHLTDQPGFLAECARVLPSRGLLLLTTPNAATFPSGNPFHTRELRMDDLLRLLEPAFTVTHRWGVRHAARLVAEDRVHGALVDAQIASPQEAWPARLRERVESVTARSFEVGPARADDLDLVVVARRG